MKIAVIGASGFIGTRLSKMLSDKGHTVVSTTFRKGMSWVRDVQEADAVVNLAGEPIFGKRWNTYVKSEIHSSRINGTHALVDALGRAKTNNPEKKQVLVNASAIGFYGNTDDAILNENSPAGTDFLAFVCREWEEEALRASVQHKIRTAVVRIGVVIGKGGGALEKMLLPFKMGAGGPIGSGQQWMSWVHVDDVCGIIIHAIENENVSGVLNATAPNPVRNKDFARTLGAVLGRPAFIPTPGLGLRILFGEASVILTGGQKVLPQGTEASGYKFKYSALNEALNASI